MNSMTGFGVARGQVKRSHVVMEVRSVNHRFCDISFRAPGRYLLFEPDMARLIRGRFSRGKFDIFLKEESVNKEDIDIILAKKSFEALTKIQKEIGLKDPITLADVISYRQTLVLQLPQDDTETIRKPLLVLFQVALDGLQKMREQEGESLQKWFQSRTQYLLKLAASLEKQALKRAEEYRKRLHKKWKGSVVIEEARVVQEAAIMAERADVTEEIVRLKSHLQEFEKMMQQKKSNGRKLDFLAQEMGREINTIGSKSQGVRIAHQVIEFKSELERIREQIQNVE